MDYKEAKIKAAIHEAVMQAKLSELKKTNNPYVIADYLEEANNLVNNAYERIKNVI